MNHEAHHTTASEPEATPAEKLCEQLEKMSSQLPFAELSKEMKKNAQALANAVLGKMDIVSRAEFEAQNAVLAEVAAKLDNIAQKLDALEKTGRRTKKKKASTEDGAQ